MKKVIGVLALGVGLRHGGRCAPPRSRDAALGVRVCRSAAGHFRLLGEMHGCASGRLRARRHAARRREEAHAAGSGGRVDDHRGRQRLRAGRLVPNDHPKMPDIVAHGSKERGIRACALCHFPNGTGKPENAPVAGTSVIYFMNQMADFKNGLRHTADKNKANAWEMPVMAAALTPEETKQAAE